MDTSLGVNRTPEALRPRDPRRKGSWILTGRLGSGGMGTVFLGQHVDSGRAAAVKVMSESLADQGNFRERFAREIAALHIVDGPFVAGVLDWDAHSDLPWLATEYVPGPNLAELIDQQGPLSVDAWKGLAAGLLSSLIRIEQAGVVHRDLKPANVLLSPTGPRLIDFGVAKMQDASTLTFTGTTFGTPRWLAPEQIRGQDATAATDAFAAGAVLFYAATGRAPFATDSGTPEAAIHAVLNTEPDFSGVPACALAAVAGLMAKDPEHRWSVTRAAVALSGSDDLTKVDAQATAQWQHNDPTRVWARTADAGSANLSHTQSDSRASVCRGCGTLRGPERFCPGCGTPNDGAASAPGQPPRGVWHPQGSGQPRGLQPPAASRLHADRATIDSPDPLMPSGRVDVGLMTLLSTVTLGIWWLVWVFPEIRNYRRLSGRREPNVENYFWAYVIIGAVTVTLSWLIIFLLPIAFLTYFAGVVAGAMFLSQWTRDRDLAAANFGGSRNLASRTTLLALWISANLLAATFIGIFVAFPLLIVLTVLIFRSHNELVHVVEASDAKWQTAEAPA